MKIWITLATMLLILSLIVTAGWLTGRFIRSETTYMISTLEHAMVLLETEGNARSADVFCQFSERWQEKAYVWALLLHYHAIDDIDVSIARTQALLNKEDNDATLEEMAALQESLKHLAQREEIRFSYIF